MKNGKDMSLNCAQTAYRNRGFGLVEIMVGLVVGLLCMFVVMQVGSVFEQNKRETTSGSDAQTNGALALYILEREIRSAGSGMTEGEPQKYAPLAGCTTRVFDGTADYLVPAANATSPSTLAPLMTTSNIRLAPVIATDGGGGLSDSLTVAYGTALITAPYTLTANFNSGDMEISMVSTSGINFGDMVALIETDATPPNPLIGNYIIPTTCTLLQVTDGIAHPPRTPVVAAAPLPVSTGTRYNPAGGNTLNYSEDARLYNLGQLNLVTYRVDGASGDLVGDITKFGSDNAGTAAVNRTDFSPIMSGIVNMQVQYGIDTGNPGGTTLSDCKTNSTDNPLTTADADAIVDNWVPPTGIWANNGITTPSQFDLRRIRAVRIGVVARSGVKTMIDKDGDKTDVGANCATTTVAPVINWGAGPSMTPDLSGDPDWQCYRYKVFQTTIPVRNALWSGTMNPASSASCGTRSPG